MAGGVGIAPTFSVFQTGKHLSVSPPDEMVVREGIAPSSVGNRPTALLLS